MSPPDDDGDNLDHLIPLLPTTWTKRLIPDILGSTFITAMYWSCKGSLCSSGNILTSKVRTFLTEVARLIDEHDVDVMWLNDAHCIKGSMTPYLPFLRQLLPNSRIYQFPTTIVQSRGGCASNDRMGGALAIVSHNWRGFNSNTSTDPMGMGILNSLDLVRGPYKFRVINVYLPPSTGGDGRGTICSRVTQYQQRSKMPSAVKKLHPIEFLLDLLQKWISAARKDNFTVIIGGDFNIELEGRKLSPRLATWMYTNDLTAPFAKTLHLLADYCTWFTSLTSSVIDHIMHTPLPSNIATTQHGTVNNIRINHMSDHHPLWISLCLTDPLTPVPKRRPSPPPLRIDFDINNKPDVLKYGECISKLVSKMPKKFRTLQSDGTTTSDPHQSSRGLAALQRLSYQAVYSKTGLNRKQKQRLKKRCLGRRSAFKDGFSPEMRLLQVYRDFYQQLIRRAFPTRPSRRSRTWNASRYQQVLTQWTTEWTKANQHTLDQIRVTSRVHQIPPPSHLTLLSFHSITLDHLQRILRTIKGKLHGAMRIIMRAEMSAEIRRRDQLRWDKRIGEMVEAMSGNPREQLDLRTLPCPIRGQIVDHHDIHLLLTAFFADWYAVPPDLDAAAQCLSTHPHLWSTLLDKDEHLTMDSTIFSNNSTTTSNTSPLDVRPSLAEFQHAIETVTDSTMQKANAEERSQHTADVIKQWSVESRTLVFNQLTMAWPLSPSYTNQTPTQAHPYHDSIRQATNKLWSAIKESRAQILVAQEITAMLQASDTSTPIPTPQQSKAKQAKKRKPTEPQLLHPDSAIPPALQDGLRRACKRKVSENFCDRMSNTIAAPITYKDFTQSLKGIKNGGAPGPSLATANMVKAWPEDVSEEDSVRAHDQHLVFSHVPLVVQGQGDKTCSETSRQPSSHEHQTDQSV
jgi:hypothetical protein